MDVKSAILAAAGAPVRRFMGPTLGILMYHAVVQRRLPVPDWCFLSLERFEAQIRWLAAQPIDVLPLAAGCEALLAGRLERPAVAITFDDGYRNNI